MICCVFKEQGVQPDGEFSREVSFTAEDDKMFDDMLLFIIQCLPATLSVIKTDQVYDRVVLLKKLILRDDKGRLYWLSYSRSYKGYS